jgi:hypothetical protein
MRLLFVDESGRPDEPTFAVGGVSMAGDEWPVLAARWRAALARHAWPPDREIKWHWIRTGAVPPDLADDLFQVLAGAPIVCLVVVLRPVAGRRVRPDLFASDEDTYATALMFLAERYQRSLVRADEHGVVILDSRRPEADDRVRRYFERLQREGTPYLRLDRVVDSILLGPSHRSLGLQAADLVVASTLGAERRLGDALRWHRALLPRFVRHPDTGRLEGVGLVVYPRRPAGPEPPPGRLFDP